MTMEISALFMFVLAVGLGLCSLWLSWSAIGKK